MAMAVVGTSRPMPGGPAEAGAAAAAPEMAVVDTSRRVPGAATAVSSTTLSPNGVHRKHRLLVGTGAETVQALPDPSGLAPASPAAGAVPVLGDAVGSGYPAEAGAAPAMPMRTLTRTIAIDTAQHVEFVDVTDRVLECVAEARVAHGCAIVFSRHTTAGVRINEHEPLLLQDMIELLDRLAPRDARYRHDDFTVRTVNLTDSERVNGHSHCRSLLLGASESIPIVGGQLMLGRWQRVFLVELDGPSHRELIIQVIGS